MNKRGGGAPEGIHRPKLRPRLLGEEERQQKGAPARVAHRASLWPLHILPCFLLCGSHMAGFLRWGDVSQGPLLSGQVPCPQMHCSCISESLLDSEQLLGQLQASPASGCAATPRMTAPCPAGSWSRASAYPGGAEGRG